jgi:hypothetical protein
MAPWAKSTLFTVWEELPGLNGNSSSVVRQTELKYSIFIPMCLGQGFQCRLGKSLPSPGTPLGAAVPNSLRPWCRETSGPCCLSSANCPQVLSSFSIWIWIPLHCTTGIQCCFIHTHTHTHARTHARTHTHTHTHDTGEIIFQVFTFSWFFLEFNEGWIHITVFSILPTSTRFETFRFSFHLKFLTYWHKTVI